MHNAFTSYSKGSLSYNPNELVSCNFELPGFGNRFTLVSRIQCRIRRQDRRIPNPRQTGSVTHQKLANPRFFGTLVCIRVRTVFFDEDCVFSTLHYVEVVSVLSLATKQLFRFKSKDLVMLNHAEGVDGRKDVM